jgi:histidinol-phosphate/aromatic aminotransferase/cobyric acid decarboxylase-like protein
MRIDDGCFHGGAFFTDVGEDFRDLWRRERIVNADVLDAWFAPAPGALAAIRDHLDWLARTSPPTSAAGLRSAIAATRALPEPCVLPHAGSSALIFLALRQWLTPRSRVLLLDPCYGEYGHVLERVIGCAVERVPLWQSDGWMPDLGEMERRLRGGHDMVVLVNPNNPTGQLLPRTALEALIARVSPRTRFWIDEAYLDYVDPSQSMEPVAATQPNVFVCKSLSKVYALSGLRAAYLVGTPDRIASLRPLVPPWAVSLPAQVAAVRALEDPVYYRARYRETDLLRSALRSELQRLPGIVHVAGNANFLLCQLDSDAPVAADVVAACRREGVHLRDVAGMGRALGPRVFRTAVKESGDNERIVGTLRRSLASASSSSRDLVEAPVA